MDDPTPELPPPQTDNALRHYFDYIKATVQILVERGISLGRISEESGLHRVTIQKLFDPEERYNPRIETMIAVEPTVRRLDAMFLSEKDRARRQPQHPWTHNIVYRMREPHPYEYLVYMEQERLRRRKEGVVQTFHEKAAAYQKKVRDRKREAKKQAKANLLREENFKAPQELESPVMKARRIIAEVDLNKDPCKWWKDGRCKIDDRVDDAKAGCWCLFTARCVVEGLGIVKAR